MRAAAAATFLLVTSFVQCFHFFWLLQLLRYSGDDQFQLVQDKSIGFVVSLDAVAAARDN